MHNNCGSVMHSEGGSRALEGAKKGAERIWRASEEAGRALEGAKQGFGRVEERKTEKKHGA